MNNTTHKKGSGYWSKVCLPGAVAALLAVSLDQASKWWAMRFLAGPPRTEIEVVPGFLRLAYTTNPGAAWGLFSEHTFWLAVISLIVMAILIWRFPAMAEGWPERGLGLGFLIGGVAGNLADRIWRGAVVDFIDVNLHFYDWPVFNVADSAICVGIAIYLLSVVLRKEAL